MILMPERYLKCDSIKINYSKNMHSSWVSHTKSESRVTQLAPELYANIRPLYLEGMCTFGVLPICSRLQIGILRRVNKWSVPQKNLLYRSENDYKTTQINWKGIQGFKREKL